MLSTTLIVKTIIEQDGVVRSRDEYRLYLAAQRVLLCERRGQARQKRELEASKLIVESRFNFQIVSLLANCTESGQECILLDEEIAGIDVLIRQLEK